MANIKAKVRQNPERITAQTLKLGSIALSDLTDVNVQGQTDGAMLIYDGTTASYVATPVIGNENTNIIGGTY